MKNISEQELSLGNNETETSEIRKIDQSNCEDREGKFRVTLEVVDRVATVKRRDCIWARNNISFGTCFYAEVKKNCPKLCQTCDLNSQAEEQSSHVSTSSPTTAPTKSPTAIPMAITTSTPTITLMGTPTVLAFQSKSPTLPPTNTITIPPTVNPIASIEITVHGEVGNSLRNDTVVTSITEGSHEEPSIEVVSKGYKQSTIGMKVASLGIAIMLCML